MLKTRTILAGIAIVVAFSAAAARISAAEERPDEAKLIAVLTSDQGIHEKQMACRQLAIYGTKQAVPALAALLTDEKLSHMARYALEPIPDPSASAALRDALPKVQGRLLVGVINSIAHRRDADAVGALTNLLKHQDVEIATTAAAALGRIANEQAVGNLARAIQENPSAAMAEGCLICADTLLTDGKTEAGTAMFDRVRSANVPRLMKVAAVRGAILSRKDSGIPMLVEQIKGQDPYLFNVALRLIEEWPNPGTAMVQAISNQAKALPEERQMQVIHMLMVRGDATARPAIMAAAKDGPGAARLAAVRALARLGDISAIPMLFELAQGGGELGRAAQTSLASIRGKDVDDAILARLESQDVNTRLIVLDVLSQRLMPGLIPVLLRATEDQQIRLVAIRSLGEVGTINEVPALVNMLLKARGEVQTVENALASMCVRADAPEECAQILTSALPRANAGAKVAILRILRSVGGTRALAAVRVSLKDERQEVRDASVRVLGEWTTLDAAPDLLQLARSSDNQTTKVLALRGYLRLTRDRQMPPDQRLEMCREALKLAQRPEEKRLVLGALGNIPSADSLSMVMGLLQDEQLQEEACAAAIAIGERLVQRDPQPVLKAMQKVTEVAKNADLGKRAKQLQDRAATQEPRRTR